MRPSELILLTNSSSRCFVSLSLIIASWWYCKIMYYLLSFNTRLIGFWGLYTVHFHCSGPFANGFFFPLPFIIQFEMCSSRYGTDNILERNSEFAAISRSDHLDRIMTRLVGGVAWLSNCLAYFKRIGLFWGMNLGRGGRDSLILKLKQAH